MDDNDRPSREYIVSECMETEDIIWIDWPPYSNELKPIEQMCGALRTECQIAKLLPELCRFILLKMKLVHV